MSAKLSPPSEEHTSNAAPSLYERGLERFRAADYDGAIKDLEKAVELGVDTPDLYLILGQLYTDKWDRKRAVASFDRFFALIPLDQVAPKQYEDYAQVYLARARAHSRHFDHLDAAIADCTRALELAPNLATAYRERGRLHALQQQWDAVIPDCTRAIELDPIDARAHEMRGGAYSELGKYRQAVSDFDRAIALDPDCIFPYLDRGYLRAKFTPDPVALDLLEVGVWKAETIAPGSGLPEEMWGQTTNHVQRVVNGEEWRVPLRMAQERGFAPDTDELKSFSSRCWREIIDRRRYQVPVAGRAEILASEDLRRIINLYSLQFVQEGIEPPGVFLKFQFSEGASVGIVRIWRHGSVDGWHSRVRDSLFEKVINAVALSYYRDLVTPGTIYEYEPGTGTTHTGLSNRPRPLPRKQSVAVASAASPKARTGTRTSTRRSYHLRDWYYVQERARHYVTGHLRFIQPGYVAPKQKQLEAEECTGRRLPVGYTWVVEHERGGQSPGGLRLRQGRLPDYTVFLPPERASHELSQILGY